MPDSKTAGSVVIAGLTHDLLSKRSLATLTWEGVADKRLVLDVPFGCTLSDYRSKRKGRCALSRPKSPQFRSSRPSDRRLLAPGGFDLEDRPLTGLSAEEAG